MKSISKLSICNLVMVAGILAGGPAHATLDLSQDPLFLVAPVKPALIMAIDDSGSMDSEVIFPTNDGALWWNTSSTRRSFTGQGVSSDGNSNVDAPGVLNFNAQGAASGTWKKFTYLFPNGHDGTGAGSHRRIYNDSTNDHYAIPPLPQYAYARSPEYNAIYFDPFESYPVPPSAGSATFTNADPTAALSDWTQGTSTLNLTEPQRSTADNWVFRMYRGMTVPAGTVVRQASSNACQPFNTNAWNDWNEVLSDTPIDPGNCSVAIEYFPATFWLPQGAPLPAGFGYSATPIQGGLSPDGSPMVGYEIKSENFSSTAAYEAAIQNFANWFQYYRKRSLSTRTAIGRAFNDTSFLRAGYFRINNRSEVTMRDLGNAGDRQAFFDWHYNLRDAGGTPNKEAVHHMGNQFRRTGEDAPILLACQRNFGMLFTDGYANAWTEAGVGNADGDLPDPLGDDQSNTMADIAYYHYANNLREDLEAGQVPTPTRCNQPDPPLHLNCQSNPHMQLFGVTLNTPGLIFGVDEAATEDPWTNHPEWPGTFPNRHPSAVDDLWHATLNTRGELFSTTRPGELVEALSTVLSQIASSAMPSGVSATSTRLDADSNIFVANLDSTAWSGNIEARNALTQDTVWSAEDELPDPADRVIRTSADGSEIDFDLTLPSDVRDRIFGTGHDGSVADQVIRYLRGERAGLEQSMGGPYRDRDGRIGDIVNSRPAYSGVGNEGWARLPAVDGGGASGAGSYGAYVDGTKASRTPLVLVGANDGMLHIFDAETGVELYAYIPEAVQHKLAALAHPEYSHQFYVDGQITVRDVRIGSNWRTVAVVTLGAGGRGIFALDITDPEGIELLWEINSDTLPGLGYTFGEPIITRLGNGSWVTIFGNGYNSDDTRARLYVASIETGIVSQTISLGNGTSNGLSGAAVLLDPVSRLHASRVYAGDLLGNMWRVDFDAGGAGTVAYNQGLFTDPNGRAITSTPTLAANPDGGLMVFYGSGKLLEPSDRLASNYQTDRLYALIDRGSRINNINQLGAASMTVVDGERVINAANVGARGWYLNLQIGDPSGERILTRPQVVFGQLVFSTFEPLSDPCATGGVNRVFVLNALSGEGNLPSCPGCGVIDVGEGAPIDPAVFINPPQGPGTDDGPPPPGTVIPGDPDDPDDPGGPTVPDLDPDADPQDWCSDQVIYNPSTGEYIVVGKICDGRQSWRQAR